MKKEETTYGLSPERLARLLAIGLEGGDSQEKAPPSQPHAEELQNMLASALPLDRAMPDSLPAVLDRPCGELSPVAGRSMSDLILDSKTDVAVLKTLKDYGKKLVRRRGPKAKQPAATVIYYAAIASALVFQGQKITQHSYEKLLAAWTDLEQKPWIPSEIKDLFRRAGAVCQRQEREPE